MSLTDLSYVKRTYGVPVEMASLPLRGEAA